MIVIQLNQRQQKIIEIVKENEPITSESIASILNVTRATLRSDLAILTTTGILDARPKVGYFYSGISGASLVGNKIKDKKVKICERNAHNERSEHIIVCSNGFCDL